MSMIVRIPILIGKASLFHSGLTQGKMNWQADLIPVGLTGRFAERRFNARSSKDSTASFESDSHLMPASKAALSHIDMGEIIGSWERWLFQFRSCAI